MSRLFLNRSVQIWPKSGREIAKGIYWQALTLPTWKTCPPKIRQLTAWVGYRPRRNRLCVSVACVRLHRPHCPWAPSWTKRADMERPRRAPGESRDAANKGLSTGLDNRKSRWSDWGGMETTYGDKRPLLIIPEVSGQVVDDGVWWAPTSLQPLHLNR